MAQLIALNKPDASGNVIPPDAHEGSAMFASTAGPHEMLNLVVSGGEYNVETATCCNLCPCCDGVVCYDVSPSSAYLPDGDTYQLYATVYWKDGTHTDVTGSTSWVSGKTSVARVSVGGLVTGVAPGAVTIDGHFDGIEPGQVCNYCLQCIAQRFLSTCNMSVETLGSLDPEVISTPVSGQTNSLVSGQSGQVTVTAYDQFGSKFTGYTGAVQLSSTDSLATLPSAYTYTSSDAGAHTFSVTLKTVSGTLDARDVTATDNAAGIHGTANVYLWFKTGMDEEVWHNCNVTTCPDSGAYACKTSCDSNGLPQGSKFIAVTQSGNCNTGVLVEAQPVGGGAWSTAQSTTIQDCGPASGGGCSNPYWNTGSVPSMGGCLSDALMGALGIAHTCSAGQANTLWRFQ